MCACIYVCIQGRMSWLTRQTLCGLTQRAVRAPELENTFSLRRLLLSQPAAQLLWKYCPLIFFVPFPALFFFLLLLLTHSLAFFLLPLTFCVLVCVSFPSTPHSFDFALFETLNPSLSLTVFTFLFAFLSCEFNLWHLLQFCPFLFFLANGGNMLPRHFCFGVHKCLQGHC